MASGFKQPDAQLLDALKDIVGERGWTTGEQAPRFYEDPRGRFQGEACLILMPASAEEVSAIVKLCNESGAGIVPYSGGTGVVAGQISIDSGDAIVLSMERMNKVREISVDDGVMVVEAGCILENIHNAAAEQGMTFPLSMASKGSCCIGGNLATNAGGIQVVRHGNARDLCLGIEAVLPDGEIYSALSPLRKNNTGYDLRHLLIGSEGTLGIITAATIIIKPIDPETVTAFCAVGSPADALQLYKHVQKYLGESISALELMCGLGIDLVTGHFTTLNKPMADDHDWFLLLEADGPLGISGKLEEALGEAFENGLALDAVIAQSQAQRQSLWDLREHTPEANRSAGAFCNSDTSVPISKVDAFIAETVRMVLEIHPDIRFNTYGHIGDGNIHHNLLPPEGISKADFVKANPGIIEATRMAINDATLKFGGSISAEHGIGRLKVNDVEVYSSVAKLETMKRIKRAMDPNNIMNPGALVTWR
jgi:FAD/FMN-containing dehydrogenase